MKLDDVGMVHFLEDVDFLKDEGFKIFVLQFVKFDNFDSDILF